MGSRLLLHATAVGKVLLVDARAEVLEAELRDLRPVTARTITDPAELVAQLVVVRNRGFARTSDEMGRSTASAAVPVRDQAGRTVAGIGLVTTDLKRAMLRRVPALAVSAGEVSRAIQPRAFHLVEEALGSARCEEAHPAAGPGERGPTPRSGVVAAGCNVHEVSEWAAHNNVGFMLGPVWRPVRGWFG